jgi:class 3 adenylate cyclase
MAEARVERRLAAILAADVSGYSRLMGLDEEGTLAALKAYRREIIDPKIAEHRGRIVKTTGDGVLVEFASTVDAVRCAIDIYGAAIRMRAGGRENRNNCAEPRPVQALFDGAVLRLPCVNRDWAGQAAGPAMSAMPR